MAWGAILQIVSGVVGGIAGYRQELGRAAQLKFDAQVAENNAELARQDQLISAERGAQERAALSKEEQQVRGEGRVGYAAGNVVVDEGTPLEYDIAQAQQYARERERSKDEQALQIHRLEVERQSLLAGARMGRRAAKRTKRDAWMSGFNQGSGGVIGGVNSMSRQRQYKAYGEKNA